MDHYKVYDKDGKLLVSDIVVSIKSDKSFDFVNNGPREVAKINLISFDTRYFLNTNFFRCELVQKEASNLKNYSYEKIEFDIKNFSKYPIVNWAGSKNNVDAPIYFDYGYNELDPEVESLVHTLNSLPAVITSSSCSGHGKNPLFVMMNIYDFETILFLNNIINVHFHNDFYLGTNHMLYVPKFSSSLFVQLISSSIGEVAYAKAKELEKVIEANKENIYPLSDKFENNLNGLRVQVYDIKDNLLVDDIVRKTFHTVNSEHRDQGFLHKNILYTFYYISFDGKYYLDFKSKFFKMKVYDSTFLNQNTNFNVIKFDIDKFKSYRIDDIQMASFSRTPVCIDNRCN